mgnify:CR=1 FL=1
MYKKLFKAYKRIYCFFRDMRLEWKLTCAYFIIIALPIVGTGLFINYTTTQSFINQSQLLMKQSLIQKREIINYKIDSIERTSIYITQNPQIIRYLDIPFENNYRSYENYYFTFCPLFESYIMQNQYIYNTILYVENTTFPDAWNGIYHMDRIKENERFRMLLEEDKKMEMWYPIHDSQDSKEKVFSFARKLISFSEMKVIGILEIEITEKLLFKDLYKDKKLVEYYLVLDDKGNVITTNLPSSFLNSLKVRRLLTQAKENVIDGVLEFENQRFIASTVPISRIGCSLVGISPLTTFMADNGDYRTMILVVIAISLILFGTIIHLVANRLTKRLKILVKALKSMRNDNINVKIPVVSHDEIGELAVSFNLMTDRIYELIERVYKAQIMEKEYELKALEAHINPHFLYNSLSTISWMARKINAENIDNMAFLLSKFYRLVLSKGNSVITVQDEINHLKAYVEIERTRFGDSFQVIYDVDPESLDCKMIKIILQPIVENSIKHGLAAKDYRGTIIVRVKQDREYLYLTVIDDGIGMDSQVLESLNRGEDLINSESGYGIRNIRERIKAVYGERGHIKILSRPGVGCTVNITIPKTVKFLNL